MFQIVDGMEYNFTYNILHVHFTAHIYVLLMGHEWRAICIFIVKYENDRKNCNSCKTLGLQRLRSRRDPFMTLKFVQSPWVMSIVLEMFHTVFECILNGKMESRCNACIEKFLYKCFGLENQFPTKVFRYLCHNEILFLCALS